MSTTETDVVDAKIDRSLFDSLQKDNSNYSVPCNDHSTNNLEEEEALDAIFTFDCCANETVQLFCWNFLINNRTGKELGKTKIYFDIQSFQNNAPFVLGPGLFGLAPPVGPNYNVVSSLNGTVNPSYAGSDLLFTANRLPQGSSTITVCANFDPLNPDLTNTVFIYSTFTVDPAMQNCTCGREIAKTTTLCVLANNSCTSGDQSEECLCNCKHIVCAPGNLFNGTIPYCLSAEECPIYDSETENITLKPLIVAANPLDQPTLDVDARATIVQVNFDATATVLITDVVFGQCVSVQIDHDNLHQLLFYEPTNPADPLIFERAEVVDSSQCEQ